VRFIPEEGPAAARFDPALDAWILSRFDDVTAALHDPRLAALPSGDPEHAHLAVRQAILRSLTPRRLCSLRPRLEGLADAMAGALPADRVLDLVATLARPWSLEVARLVTAAPSAEAAELDGLARKVFLAAADGTGNGVPPAAAAASSGLAHRLPGPPAISVQTFVALSQTLPHLLAGAWLALFAEPRAEEILRAEPERMPAAMEELLRLGGPSRTVFRYALADVRIGNVRIRAGERVALRLASANRDGSRFGCPQRVDFLRSSKGHLSFGGGAHACSGARLVRVLVAAVTRALLRTADAVEMAGPVEWIRGPAIRAPWHLPVILRRHRAEPAAARAAPA
jgi:hypothetical protein